MRVVVIGGTGHVGTFLIPRLIREGYEVVCIHRGGRRPYLPDPAWKKVQHEIMDRKAEDAAGTFGMAAIGLAACTVRALTGLPAWHGLALTDPL